MIGHPGAADDRRLGPAAADRAGAASDRRHGAIGTPLEGAVDLRRMTRELGVRHVAAREKLHAGVEREAAGADFLAAASGGVRGLIDDYLTYCRAWGFSPREIAVEVHLWHGLEDPLVPVDHALRLAATLPRCRVVFDPDEGHHVFRRRLRDILAMVVGDHTGAGARA